jgi:hypothetical protein
VYKANPPTPMRTKHPMILTVIQTLPLDSTLFGGIDLGQLWCIAE